MSGWRSTALPPPVPRPSPTGSPKRCARQAGPRCHSPRAASCAPPRSASSTATTTPTATSPAGSTPRRCGGRSSPRSTPGGSGRVLPDLWDPVTDRATRTPYVTLPPGGFLLLHGPFLFGHWFPFDLGVHLSLTEAALRRRTPEEEHWILPAFARYEAEETPLDVADLVVRTDDPRHPARRVPQD